jgi:hypothetical protein
VDAGADLDVRVKGLVWGMGFEWETTIFDVTPTSYAQCGLYFQFHRKEQNRHGNIDEGAQCAEQISGGCAGVSAADVGSASAVRPVAWIRGVARSLHSAPAKDAGAPVGITK